MSKPCYVCSLLPHDSSAPFPVRIAPSNYSEVNMTWLSLWPSYNQTKVFLTDNTDPEVRLSIHWDTSMNYSVCFHRYEGNGTEVDREAFNHCSLSNPTVCIRKNVSSPWQKGLPGCRCQYTFNLKQDTAGRTMFNSDHPIWLPDWYWDCDRGKLWSYLPSLQRGLCALVQVQHAFTVVPVPEVLNTGRRRRSVDDDFFPPREHQLESKWNKFWQSLVPQYGLTQVWNQLEVTHYRLATFVNATNAAMEGIRVELTALRLMTTQNRMALDILLAKEGGVCAMIGDSCCTFVPNKDDESFGEIAKQLGKMRQVAHDLHMDEQASSPWGWGWLHVLFGGLAPYISMIIPVVFIGLLVCLCGPFLFRCCMDRIYNMMISHTGYVPVSATTGV